MIAALRLLVLAAVLDLAIAAPARAQAPPAAALEAQLIDAVRAAPERFDAHAALGEFYLHGGRVADAIPNLERARDLDPSHDANGRNLALAYLQTDRVDRARAEVARMLAARPTPELHNLLGEIEERAGDRVAAAVAFQTAARLSPTEDHLFDWGNNLLQLGAHGDAADVFAAAVRRHPDSARTHIGLGIAQYSRGQHEDAVRSFCRAADLAPSDPRPYDFLGEMYGVSPDQNSEVTRRLARFVELQPSSANGHYYYAMNLWKGASGTPDPDLARVEALLRRAVALDTTHAKARLQLGILLSELGRWRDAITELRAAAVLEPDQPQVYFRLANAYRRDGQTALADDALETFQRLKARTPPAPADPK